MGCQYHGRTNDPLHVSPSGYDNADWTVPFPALKEEDAEALSPEQAEGALAYFGEYTSSFLSLALLIVLVFDVRYTIIFRVYFELYLCINGVSIYGTSYMNRSGLLTLWFIYLSNAGSMYPWL